MAFRVVFCFFFVSHFFSFFDSEPSFRFQKGFLKGAVIGGMVLILGV